jgi:hypothetical protein
VRKCPLTFSNLEKTAIFSATPSIYGLVSQVTIYTSSRVSQLARREIISQKRSENTRDEKIARKNSPESASFSPKILVIQSAKFRRDHHELHGALAIHQGGDLGRKRRESF